MRKKIRILIFLIFALSLNPLWAYDGKVHRKINENAANQNNSILHDVLRIQIGIIEGVDATLKKDNQSKTIMEWIAYGGEAEDFGMPWDIKPLSTRAFNHFHDPLKVWDNAGLDSIIDVPYRGRYWRDPTSSILWGLDPDNQDFSRNTTGDWSWGKAREYYYIYLTGNDFEGNVVADSQDEREANFADCFRSLGQLMHLMGDMSVPLHTRNDVHVFPIVYGYVGPKTIESYTLKNKDFLNYSAHPPDQVLLTDPQPQSNYSHLVPISGLFDRNEYNDGGSIPSDNNVIGLAEYSNANFLTEDTMWTYQHPALSDTNYASLDWSNPEPIDAEDGKTDNRIYIKKTQGEQIDHFAAIDYFTLEYYEHFELIYSPFHLDEECHKEYASKLIPRAVGYSAGLLDYFFRGTIEITNPLIGSNINANSGLDPADYNHITLFARNTAPDGEDMSLGTFQLVVKYRLSEQDPFQYIVEEEINNTSSIPSDTAQELEFDLSDNLVPSDAVDLSLYLVYKGKLGQEDDAVGVGFQQPFNNIKISLPDSGVYALTDIDPDVIDPTQQGFDRITLLAQNTSPEGEEMTGGTVTLVVKYKVGEGDQFQNPPAATSDEFHYIVKELGGTHSIPRVTPALFEFNISNSQIPLWATDVYISLVYKGNLGSEEGAIAVGFKDITEPTPINYYNVMDKICMTTSTGPQLFDSGSTAAIDYVDADNNGIADPDEWDVYPHNAANIHIRFSPEDNPQAATSASSADNNYEKAILNPNDYFRLFILSDYRFNRSASVEVVKIADDDQCDQFHGTFSRPPRDMDAIKNQTDLVDPVYCGYEPCNARLTTGFHTTRGVVSFFSVIFDNASYPIDSICSYED